MFLGVVQLNKPAGPTGGGVKCAQVSAVSNTHTQAVTKQGTVLTLGVGVKSKEDGWK